MGGRGIGGREGDAGVAPAVNPAAHGRQPGNQARKIFYREKREITRKPISLGDLMNDGRLRGRTFGENF